MNKSEIRKEIAALIDSIKEHSDNIGNNNRVPQLELELILHKIRNLYEKSIVYNYLNTIIEAQDIQPSVETTISIEKKEPIATPPIDLFGSELAPAEAKPKAERKSEKKEAKASVSTIQKPPVTDLKSAIGINDQFQFANELFEGNIQEYGIAIQQLNTAGTLESAIDYYSNLQQLYNWDTENDTAKRLLDLVDRRYSA